MILILLDQSKDRNQTQDASVGQGDQQRQLVYDRPVSLTVGDVAGRENYPEVGMQLAGDYGALCI